MKPSLRVALAVVPAILAVGALWLATRGRGGDAASAVDPLMAPPPEVDAGSVPPAADEGLRAEASAPAGSNGEADVATRSGLVLGLRDQLGAPIAAATVVLLDAASGFQVGESDSAGRVRFEPRDGRGRVLVAARAHGPRQAEVELAAGDREVVLGLGASVSGWVSVDGAPPREPFELRLEHDRAPFASLELPKPVREALRLDQELVATTSEDGGFAFRGLAPDWRGKLWAPRGYKIAGDLSHGFGRRDVVLDAPSESVRLDLQRLPHLVARFVEPDGRGAARIAVLCAVSYPQSHTSRSLETDGDGRIEVPLFEAAFDEVELSVAMDALGFRRKFLRADVPDDLDLGDLSLEPRLTVRFRAVDTVGQAIAKARGRIVGDERWSETDASGEAVTGSPSAGDARLRVVARGFWAAEVPVVVPGAATVVVALERSNRLEVRAVGADGKPARGVQIRISSSGPPLFPDSGRWMPDEVLAGSPSGSGSDVHDGPVRTSSGYLQMVPDAQGRVALQGIVPGQPLVVAVLDALENELRSVQVEPLGRDEAREVEIALGETLRTLAGRIVDAEGVPLDRTMVRVLERGHEIVMRLSDTEGRFEARGLSAPVVSVQLHRAGFAKRTLVDVRLPEERTELDITLERGRALEVEVADPRGARVAGGELRIFDDQGTALGYFSPAETGRFLAADLPIARVVLALDLAGRRYEIDNVSHEPVARFVVPVHGELVAKLSDPQVAFPSFLTVHAVPIDASLKPRELSANREAPVASFGPTLPGEYDLKLVSSRSGSEPVTLATKRVRVEADATAAVELP